MKATYFGHSTVHLDLNGTRILFDPFITPNELAKDIEIGSINPHYIFLSHCHGDHVHDMAQIQQQSDAQVVAIVETGDWVQKQGVPEDKVTAMNFGGTMNGGFGSAKWSMHYIRTERRMGAMRVHLRDICLNHKVRQFISLGILP